MAHQVQLRMAAAAGRQRALIGGGLRAGLEAATYAWTGCGITWLLRLLPVPRWHAFGLGMLASGIICAVVRWRAAAKETGELKRFVETARRGAEGDWECLGQAIACEELQRAAVAVEELLRAGDAEREELSAKIAGLEDDLRQVTEEAARRAADLEHTVAKTARNVRESALMVHATANLLARDSADRLDAAGRERLEQLRHHAEAVDQRLRDWIDGGSGGDSLRKSDSMTTGVAAGGGNGSGVRRA